MSFKHCFNSISERSQPNPLMMAAVLGSEFDLDVIAVDGAAELGDPGDADPASVEASSNPPTLWVVASRMVLLDSNN